MPDIFSVIKIDSANDYQYAVQIEDATLSQLVLLNAMLDVAKAKIIDAINRATVSEPPGEQ